MAEEASCSHRWIVAIAFLTEGGYASRLADIGPAPRTVLIDSGEKPSTLGAQGQVVLVSFVYTTCNGVCPLTTQALTRVQKKLEDAKLWGKSVEFVSITLDPERDTAGVLENTPSRADLPGGTS